MTIPISGLVDYTITLICYLKSAFFCSTEDKNGQGQDGRAS
jgi:hypothetical protein